MPFWSRSRDSFSSEGGQDNGLHTHKMACLFRDYWTRVLLQLKPHYVNAKCKSSHQQLSRNERICFDHLFNIQAVVVLLTPTAMDNMGYIVWVGFPQFLTQQLIQISINHSTNIMHIFCVLFSEKISCQSPVSLFLLLSFFSFFLSSSSFFLSVFFFRSFFLSFFLY